MSTLSGVFPNAITPTFAASTDPAQQSRLRRENETVVFSPVEEVESTADSRRTAIEQPGRLEAERLVETQPKSPQVQNPTSDESEVSESAPVVRQVQQSREPDGNSEQQEADLDLIRQLAARDREVRDHEQAHQSAGGQYTGATSFTFEQGPDGRRYAVAGEVSLENSRVFDNPEATLQKAEQIRRAALAPEDPSAQDLRVAAQAVQIALEARSDIREEAVQVSEKEAEDRAEQASLKEQGDSLSESSSVTDDNSVLSSGSENEERLSDIFEQTQKAAAAALAAAYQLSELENRGFNIDTII